MDAALRGPGVSRQPGALPKHARIERRIELDGLEGVTHGRRDAQVRCERLIERLASAGQKLRERAVSGLQHFANETLGLREL